MPRLQALLFAAAFWCVAAPLWAEPAPPERDPAKVFADLDQNDDGQISDDEVPEESRRLHKRLLRQADANEDGLLSRDEFSAGLAGEPAEAGPEGEDRPRPPREGRPERGPRADRAKYFEQMQQRLLDMDANGDGKVELDEAPEPFQDRFGRMLEQLDSDGDDALSKEELAAGAKFMAQRFGGGQGGPEGPPGGPDGRRRRTGGPNGPPNGPPGGPGRGPGGPDGPPGKGLGQGRGPGALMEKLKQADANGDGNIELSEVPEQFREGFQGILDHLDTNGDDVLSKEEIAAGRPDVRQRFGGQGGGPGGPPGGPEGMWQRLKHADEDGDGKISQDEAPPPLQGNFAQVDKNQDGFIEQDEARAYGETMREKLNRREKKAAAKLNKAKKAKNKKKPGKPNRPGGRPGKPGGPDGPPPGAGGPPSNAGKPPVENTPL